MMNYFVFKKCFYCLLAGIVFASCIKKGAFDFSDSSVNIDGTWGLTLINDEVAFTDFRLDSALSILSDEDVIRIVYQMPLVTSGTLEELLPVYDYEWHFSLTDIEEPSGDTLIFSGNQDILFYEDTNNILVDSAVLNAGNFRLVLNSTINYNVVFRLKSAYFHYADGRKLDMTIAVPSNASNFPIDIDLTGCKVKLRNNSLPCEIEIVAYHDGRPLTGEKKSVDVDVYGTLYVFKLVQGKVAAITERISAETDFIINSDNMSFRVQNIRGGKIRMNSFNRFGTGVKINIDTCNIITNGISTKLLSPANSTFEFEPAITHYTTKNQSFTIPVNDFAIAENNVFRFSALACLNEPGIRGPDIWVADISEFSIDPSLEIPLDFNLNRFVYRDTFAQEISKIENIDFLKNLTFRIELINDFPIELVAQFYFLDKDFRVVDSLFSNAMLINAAIINLIDGKTIMPGKMNPNPLFIEVSGARLDKIYNTKYISIYAKATSNNQQTIVRSDQKLKIKVGAKATVKTTLNNNK